MFDAYGTLFDVNAAVQRYADAVGPDARPPLRGLAQQAARIQLDPVADGPLRRLLGPHRAAPSTTRWRVHPQVDPGLREKLLDAYRDLDAYPEVPGRAGGPAQARPPHRGPDQRQCRDGRPGRGLGGARPTISTRCSRWTTRRCFKTHPDAYRIALIRLARRGRGRAVLLLEPLGRGGRRRLRRSGPPGSTAGACPTSTRTSRPRAWSGRSTGCSERPAGAAHATSASAVPWTKVELATCAAAHSVRP